MITNIPCVILAGGKSSRMGKDKSLLPFDKFGTLIEYQYNKLSQIFSKVYISSKTNKFNFKADLILDTTTKTSSPMIALKSILEKINYSQVFIITVDTPLVCNSTIHTLINNSSDFDITVAQDNNKVHNLCGIFSTTQLNTINSYILEDMHKINHLIQQSNSQYINFENSNQFININTADDYKKATDLHNLN